MKLLYLSTETFLFSSCMEKKLLWCLWQWKSSVWKPVALVNYQTHMTLISVWERANWWKTNVKVQMCVNGHAFRRDLVFTVKIRRQCEICRMTLLPPCHVLCHVTSVLTFDDDRQMNYYPQPCLHVLWVRCYSHFGDKAPCIQSFALVSSFAVMAQVLGICKGRTVAELSLVHILSAESPSKSTHALQMRSYSIHAWRL